MSERMAAAIGGVRTVDPGTCARRRDGRAWSARGTHRDDRDKGKGGMSHDDSPRELRGGRTVGGVPRCDVCCRLAPADVDADTRTRNIGAGNLTLGAHRSNQIERGRLKVASTKISSSNLENPGAMCLPSQISRRGAAPAGGEAHGRRWVWRRRGARSARRPRLRPRCEFISNPRDRRAHRQTLMEFARPRAHFFPPPPAPSPRI